MTTETMDKLYLEYSHLTTAKTAKELKLEAALKIAEQKLDEHLPELIGKTTRGPVYLDLLNVWTDIKKALGEK